MAFRHFFRISLAFTLIFSSICSDSSDSNVQRGLTAFTAKLNKLLYANAPPNSSVLIAPVNIYAALATIHLGAEGKTKDQLSTLLGLPSKKTKLLQAHAHFGHLLKTMRRTKSYEVRLANGVFLQKDEAQLNPSYVQQTKSYYDNEIAIVNFKDGSNATDTVNKWVSNKTKERIPKLFDSMINPATRLLIATSLYFKAAWEDEFQMCFTKTERFNTGNSEVDVQTMRKTQFILHSMNPRLQFETISLPYHRRKFSLYMVLPNVTRTLQNLVDDLTPEDYEEIIKETTRLTYVECHIPLINFKWQNSIKETLAELGVKEMFDGNADLTNMFAKSGGLSVSDVVHAAQIEIRENGTVASAATVEKMVGAALPPAGDPIKFHVNRPFLFFIYSHETKLILFTGLVHKP